MARRNTIKRILTIAVAIAMLSTNAFAAVGYAGYAVYRDGVFMNTTWHAALMDDPYSTSSLPILHHSGKGYVKWDSWSNFLSGNTFKGVYRPNRAPSSSERDRFVSLGRKMRSENIGYHLTHQVYYPINVVNNLGNYVDVNEIGGIRCDGVVEYIYEWYGYKVYGNSTNWDITKVSHPGREHHSGTKVTPKSQAQTYLTKVTSSVPKQ